MKTLMPWLWCRRSGQICSMLFIVFGFVGCGRGEAQVYQIPKAPLATTPHDHPAMSENSAPAQTQLQWTLPAGWQEMDRGEMRLASFRVNGDKGKTADVGIIALPGMAGGDLNNVNRWREQVGLSPVAAEEFAKLAESVDVGGSAAVLFDQAGTPASGDATRVIATVLHRADATWFFKMTGDDELVAKQKPVFVAFLKFLRLAGGTDSQSPLPAGHPPIGTAIPASAMDTRSAGRAQWDVPANWTKEPATQMLLAKFLVNGAGAKTEITVSSFAGDVGGLLANVNRWRGQVNLPPIDEAQLTNAVRKISVQSEAGALVELENPDGKSASLLGVAVPHDGRTWFFKMSGDAKLVAREKDTFVRFVQNVKFPNAP
jgi:hypothetical protein